MMWTFKRKPKPPGPTFAQVYRGHYAAQGAIAAIDLGLKERARDYIAEAREAGTVWPGILQWLEQRAAAIAD